MNPSESDNPHSFKKTFFCQTDSLLRCSIRPAPSDVMRQSRWVIGRFERTEDMPILLEFLHHFY
jgi:hypothetical protein